MVDNYSYIRLWDVMFPNSTEKCAIGYFLKYLFLLELYPNFRVNKVKN